MPLEYANLLQDPLGSQLYGWILLDRYLFHHSAWLRGALGSSFLLRVIPFRAWRNQAGALTISSISAPRELKSAITDASSCASMIEDLLWLAGTSI